MLTPEDIASALDRAGAKGLPPASLAYLAAPLLWVLWRARAQVLAPQARSAERALLVAWLLPLAVFALLSPVKRIGLHWLQSFLPALAITLALVAARAQLRGVVRFFAAFALLHVAVAAVVSALPLAAWKDASPRRPLMRTEKVWSCRALEAP